MTELSFSEDTLYAHISGEIDHHNSRSIRSDLDLAIKHYTPRALVLDLSGISFMDSSGLGLILGRYTVCTNAGISLAVCGVDARTMKIFDMAGLSRIINIKAK